MLEESAEVYASKNKEEATEEMADLLQAIHSLADILKIDFQKIEDARLVKAQKMGEFKDKIAIEHITLREDHPHIKYFASNPDKYEEVK